MAAGGEVVFQRGEDDVDVWDDKALIKAYDNAVSLMKVQLGHKSGDAYGGDEEMSQNGAQQQQQQFTSGKKHKKNRRKKHRQEKSMAAAPQGDRQWKVGDHCRSVYTEDGQSEMYEAVIKSVDTSSMTCVVRYLGYGNEEVQDLADLMPSAARGNPESAREAQSESEGMEWMPQYSPRPGSRTSQRGSMGRRRGGGPGFSNWPWPPSSGAPPFPGMPSYPPSFPMMPPMFPPSSLPGWPGSSVPTPPRLPKVPPPPPIDEDVLEEGDSEALYSMLIAWYMSGYHTGYYQGLKESKKRASGSQPQSAETGPKEQTKSTER